MIPRAQTELLIAQLRERGASVTDRPHAGGHQVDGAVPERLAGLISDLA